MKGNIAIIGSGNMGQAIAQGLLDKKIISQNQFVLTNSRTNNNRAMVEKTDIVILAVKPQAAHGVLQEIKDKVSNQLIISIMAGIRIATIQQALGKKVAVIRAMPNLAAKVGKSMSVWVKSSEVTKTQQTVTKTILEAIGKQLELADEEQINMATAISGSGPAYFFYLTELLEKAAENLGFTPEQARILATETLIGSAELLKLSSQSVEDFRHAVTSKGGTTEAAMEAFQKANVEAAFIKGIFAAYQKTKELG